MGTVAKEKNMGGNKIGSFKEFIERVEKFCNTEIFLFIVATVAFIFHAIAIDLFGILIFCVLAGLAFLLFKDGRAGLAITVSAIFIVSRKNSPGYMYDYSPNYYFRPQVLIPLVTVAVLVIITMIIKCVKNRKNYKNASLIIPLAVVAVAITLSGVGREHYGESFIFGLLMGLSYFGIYLLFVGCLNEKEGLMDFIATFFTALAFLVSLQVALLYVSHIAKGGTFDGYWKGKIIVGWGISNNAGAALALFLPFTVYKTEKSKNFLPYLVISLFSLAMLVLTLSRTSILMAVPVFGILFIKMLITSQNRQKILFVTVIICSVALILLMSLSAFTDFSSVFSYFEGLFNRRNPPSLSGRDKLWDKAWRFFKDSPLIGEGFARSFKEPVLQNENSLFQALFHNVVFQILGSSGVVGAIVALGFTAFAVRLYLKRYVGKATAICFGIVFVGISLFDIIYFVPYCVVYLMLVTVTIEKTAKPGREKLVKRGKAVK